MLRSCRSSVVVVPATARHPDVVVDAEHVARWDFSGNGWGDEVRTVLLPGSAGSGRDVQIRFVVHRPVSPQSIDHDVGGRQLGMSLHSLRVELEANTCSTQLA